MSTPTRLGAPAALLRTRIAAISQASSAVRTPFPAPSSQNHFSTSSSSFSAPVPPRTVPRVQAEAGVQPPRNLVELIDRYPSHPLMQFFHLRERKVPEVDTTFDKDGQSLKNRDVMIPVAIDSMDFDDDTRKYHRAWTATELRRKSSLELHQLWYVLAKEQNIYLTKMEELRRTGTKKLLGSKEPIRHHMLQVSRLFR